MELTMPFNPDYKSSLLFPKIKQSSVSWKTRITYNLDDVFSWFFIAIASTLLVRWFNFYVTHDNNGLTVPLNIIKTVGKTKQTNKKQRC